LFAFVLAFGLFAVCAQRMSVASAALSTPTMTRLGDASYSLYLLHFFVLHEFALAFAYAYPAIPRVAIYLAGMTVAIVISIVSYPLFEAPARTLIRRSFHRFHLGIVLPAVMVTIGIFSATASFHLKALDRMALLAQEGRIFVGSASF